MTYRERLAREYPEKVDEAFIGGCQGCPKDYGYEPSAPCFQPILNCKDCWDREGTFIDYIDYYIKTYFEKAPQNIVYSLVQKYTNDLKLEETSNDDNAS